MTDLKAEPPDTPDPRCPCGRNPEGDWVYRTTCPIHEGQSAVQWRTAYVELNRERIDLSEQLAASESARPCGQSCDVNALYGPPCGRQCQRASGHAGNHRCDPCLDSIWKFLDEAESARQREKVDRQAAEIATDDALARWHKAESARQPAGQERDEYSIAFGRTHGETIQDHISAIKRIIGKAEAELDALKAELATTQAHALELAAQVSLLCATDTPDTQRAATVVLVQRVATLTHDLALNAEMLARQCDLARDTETRLAALRAGLEALPRFKVSDLDGMMLPKAVQDGDWVLAESVATLLLAQTETIRTAVVE